MSKTKERVWMGITLLGLIVLSLIFSYGLNHQPQIAFGSVSQGSDYISTTTDVTSGSNATTSKICTRCAIGSIIIASSSPDFTFGVWDSVYASTTAPGTATSTKIAVIPKNLVSGTIFPIDSRTVRGIVLDIPLGFNGSYIVTYRQY